jgi:ribosomal protein S18 acetylase RimI-like enzyme
MTELDDIVIEDGQRADAGVLAELDRRNFPRADWFDRRVWANLLGDQAARGQTLTLVARQNERIVGAVVGRFRPARADVAVWSIAVDQDLRGSGLARRLTAALVERIPSSYQWMSLDARRDNARARRFYERLGFQVVREIRAGYADGMDAIQYRASLDDVRSALADGPASTHACSEL